MCRNITVLRGLDPPATQEEIEAAALQYVRKVGGLTSVSAHNADAVARAVSVVAAATAALIDALPERQTPARTLPPLRRLAARRT